jgi:Cd2+/Zn2+-exporting ATPase
MGGVLSVAYDDAFVTSDQLVQQLEQWGVSVAPSAAELPIDKEPEPETRLGQARAWLTAERVEAIAVVITFMAMMTGLIADLFLDRPTLSAVAYVVAYICGGVFGVKAGLESVRNLTIDVDILMVLAAIGAALVGAAFEGAMLLFLFSLSNVLQNYALGRTRSAIQSLMAVRPAEALVRRGSGSAIMPIEKIMVGDLVIVRPGERIPLDGTVIEGESSVNQASITGESLPVNKQVGDTVFASTINEQGGLTVRVTNLAKDSTIAKLIKLVEEAQSEKATTQRAIDKIEQYYSVAVILFTGLSIAIPVAFLDEAFSIAFYRGMTILVAASPCAVVISTPATVLSAIANGARRGVLFKGGAYVEQAATVKVVAFDKTGTLTEGKPQVTDVLLMGGPMEEVAPAHLEDDILALAAAVENRSEHPLAQAIVRAAGHRHLEMPQATAFQASAGLGVRALVDQRAILVGNRRLLRQYVQIDLTEADKLVSRLHDEGKTAVLVAEITPEGDSTGPSGQVIGVIGIADVLRSDAARNIRELKRVGIQHVVMLTGDNEKVARAIADQVGVDEFYAGLMPDDKMAILKELKIRYGPVAMVGDGVNDAPALAMADIGIAMGAAGTDVALDTADIVLMADDLARIPYVIDLSRQTRKRLTQNLVFAFSVIFILVLAVFSVNLPLPMSVIGHEGSTVIVSLNGLRMLGYDRKPRAG